MLTVYAVGDALQNVEQYFGGRLRGVNTGNPILSVIREDGLRFHFVSGEPALNDLLIRVVEPIVFKGALFQAVKKRFPVWTREMENFLHIDQLIHDFGLADIPRDAVEHENIDVRFELMCVDGGVDRFLPEFDSDVIRHELTSAGVFQKRLADFRARVDGTEYIAARAMKKTWNRSQGFTLCAFTTAGRAEKKVSVIFHGKYRL